MDALTELALLLRPAGGGVYSVSTGRAGQEAFQRRFYGAGTPAEVGARFRAALEGIPTARGFVLGIPSDTGGGIQRGANLGPQAIREALLGADPAFTRTAAALGVVDVGDVFVVPQLLQDEMLSDAQLEASRRAIYPDVPEPERCGLPVSPLSIAERALDLIFSRNPCIAPFILGGDHSAAWPVVAALARVRRDRWGIVQPDAHTDLLPERLGVKICFATWSYHANELLGRDGRLVQVGTRASRHDRAHWEGAFGVRQFWAEACRTDPARALDELIAHLKAKKVEAVYLSNDIDGTDAELAGATGTPEAGGLPPDFVLELIRRLGAEIGLLGGDVMEVAPGVRPRAGGSDRTVSIAAQYFWATIVAALDRPGDGSRAP